MSKLAREGAQWNDSRVLGGQNARLPEPPPPAYRGGGGAELVVLHGACATWRLWEPVFPLLERDFDVFAPTLPGHWGGPLVERAKVNIDFSADTIIGQMESIGWNRAHIVGGSLGGWLALELARRGVARSAVTIAPACGWSPGGPYFKSLAYSYRMMMLLAPLLASHADWWAARPRLRRLLTWHHFARPLPPELAAHLIRAVAGNDPKAAKAFLGATRTYDALTQLQGVRCPVLIAYPEHDLVLPRRLCAERLKRAIPEATITTLPGVGHAAMIDHPKLVADTIRAFTTNLSIAAA